MSLCVLRLSAIGDICHTLPVVRTLQAHLPDTPITWIIGRTEAGLIGDISGIEFITFDKRSGWSGMRAIGKQLRGRRFETLLHMQISIRASILSAFVSADRRIGFDRERARDFQWLFTNERIAPAPRQHVMEGLFGFAEALGITGQGLRWDIPVPSDAEEFAHSVIPDGRPTMVISPCSSSRFRNFRNWRPENYIAVAEHAHRVHGLDIVVTGGPTRIERDYGMRIAEDANAPVTNLVGETNLKQLFAVLQRAKVVVSPDSGPVHMATAAGTPVIGLYASSNPDRTGPSRQRQWTVNRYPEALMRECGKTVDEVRWGKRVRSPDAMDLVAVTDVTERLDALLSPSA